MYRNRFREVVFVATLGVVLAAPAPATGQEKCCFNNFRFAGGCMVIPSGSETCASILSYLNSFDSVGRNHCDNTTIRGGWSQVECGDAMDNRPQTLTPEAAQQAPPVQQRQRRVQPVDPRTAPRAQDADLLQVSAPLQVRLDESIDSTTAAPGDTVTGRLTRDLMDGENVIAPAGSVVQARIVPTSYWGDGSGDAFSVEATAITVGERTVPVQATAVEMSGPEVQLPEGTLVSFEAHGKAPWAADEATLRSATGTWVATWNARDADGHAALYAEDAVLLPPNQPAVFGRDAIRAAVADQMEMEAGAAIELEDLEVRIMGDAAYKAGRYRVSSPAGELLDRGKFIEIWARVGDQWKIHRDIWNSSLAASDPDE